MQFSVNRKLFMDKMKKFLSKGKMTLKTSNEYNIKRMKMYTFEGNLYMIGGAETDTICARTHFPVNVIEEGEVIDPEYQLIMDTIKDMDGDNINFLFTNEMIIDDGNQHSVFGLQKLMDFPDKITDFDNMHHVLGDQVKYQHTENEELKHDYVKWFSMEDIKATVSFATKLLDKVGSDIITFDTSTNKLVIEADNKSLSRFDRKSFEAKIYDQKRLNTQFLPGIISSIDGVNTFYYYITKTGKTKLFVINDDTEWLITINTAIQE